jgi:hypothetical protein
MIRLKGAVTSWPLTIMMHPCFLFVAHQDLVNCFQLSLTHQAPTRCGDPVVFGLHCEQDIRYPPSKILTHGTNRLEGIDETLDMDKRISKL